MQTSDEDKQNHADPLRCHSTNEVEREIATVIHNKCLFVVCTMRRRDANTFPLVWPLFVIMVKMNISQGKMQLSRFQDYLHDFKSTFSPLLLLDSIGHAIARLKVICSNKLVKSVAVACVLEIVFRNY